ncbi:MAG TPA: AMP-binding protein [Candidatus Binataceae bacterium]|nr:AMP-binding protein [Candidatus Binataceae bacterium]
MSNSNGTNGNATTRTAMAPLEQILRRRRILLTGATGFLGKVFLSLLLRWHPEIERIYLLIRGDRRLSQSRLRREILDSPVMGPLHEHLGERFDRYVEEKLSVLCGDITEDDLISEGEAPGRGAIDAVVHCAGLVNFEASLEKSLSVNTTGVANVIEFCRKRGAALLHVSTCYAAGNADGHRFEDDIPVDWCPNGRRNFTLRREIRDALAAVARVEAESHDQARQADELHVVSAETGGSGDAHEAAAERWRKRWIEERLKEIGLERARRWGWPNTYSYSKSLGEQLVFAAQDTIAATVARPSIIESALCDPFPGWNQGVNTSAPLTYLSGRGYRFYPAKGELVLDIIPVDLAAHAMIPILAALLAGRHKPVYQLCTSDTNPLPMRRLVELTGLSNRREHRRVGGPMGRFAPHLEAVVVSQSTYELASRTLPDLLKRGAGAARTLLGEDSERARKFEQRVDKFGANTAMARELVEVYRPYIQELVYTFHGTNLRTLYKSLAPADAGRHPYAPERIDWKDYWINVHLPGLRRHIFGSLDLHTRGRPSAPARHRTLTELLDRAAERYGARPALVARQPSGERITTSFRELRDGAHRAGLLLGMRGVKAGDRVLLIGENSPDWVLAYFAILAAGAVAVPLDHLISPEELAPICRIAAPSAALCSATVAEHLGSALGEINPEMVELEFAELSRPFVLKGRSDARPVAERKTLASIVFTSGTTGTSKGVMLTHGNFAAEVAMLARVFALDSSDVVLSLLPLHHTFEFTCGMLLPLALGATVVYPLGVDAANLARTLADVRPTAVVGVPALWEAVHRRIVDGVEAQGPFLHALFDRLRDLNRRFDREWGLNAGALLFRQAHIALGGRLKLTVSGGAALPQRVASFFSDIGIRLLEGYGLTEAAPVLSVARPDEPLAAGSVGKPLSGVEIKLAANGDGAVGEILARGPNVMAGYYRNKSATDEVLHDGWLRTGDLGRLDEDGRLYIVGRAKDVIVDSGGNNIYIDELEEIYGHSPYIKELAIVGLKVAQGEQAAALVVPDYARGESRRAVEDNLRAHFEKVGAGLSPHKRVRILRFTDTELPRTRTRKVKRLEVAGTLARRLESHAQESAALSSEVEPWLAQALAQVSSGIENITPATRLIEDLGLDSLAMAELAEHIAAHAERELSPVELADLRTVDDLQRAVGQGQNRPRLPSYARFAEPFTLALPGALKRLGEAAFRSAQRLAFDGWLQPRVLGRGNVPANRNFLVVANHASHLDFALASYALGAAGRDLVVLAAKDYFFNTNSRRFVVTNFTRLIPFDRERAQLDSLDDALDELDAGRSVLMFPEGTRSPDGAIHEFKSGAGYLALRSGYDVLPVRISGTYDVLGKGSIIPHRRPVEVRIGRVITNAELRALADNAEGTGAYRKLADSMRAAVLALGERMSFAGAPKRIDSKHIAHGDDGGVALSEAPAQTTQGSKDPTDERGTANRPRRTSARGGRRAKG